MWWNSGNPARQVQHKSFGPAVCCPRRVLCDLRRHSQVQVSADRQHVNHAVVLHPAPRSSHISGEMRDPTLPAKAGLCTECMRRRLGKRRRSKMTSTIMTMTTTVPIPIYMQVPLSVPPGSAGMFKPGYPSQPALTGRARRTDQHHPHQRISPCLLPSAVRGRTISDLIREACPRALRDRRTARPAGSGPMRSACSSSLNTRDARRLKAGAGACAAGSWYPPGRSWPGQDHRPG